MRERTGLHAADPGRVAGFAPLAGVAAATTSA